MAGGQTCSLPGRGVIRLRRRRRLYSDDDVRRVKSPLCCLFSTPKGQFLQSANFPVEVSPASRGSQVRQVGRCLGTRDTQKVSVVVSSRPLHLPPLAPVVCLSCDQLPNTMSTGFPFSHPFPSPHACTITCTPRFPSSACPACLFWPRLSLWRKLSLFVCIRMCRVARCYSCLFMYHPRLYVSANHAALVPRQPLS